MALSCPTTLKLAEDVSRIPAAVLTAITYSGIPMVSGVPSPGKNSSCPQWSGCQALRSVFPGARVTFAFQVNNTQYKAQRSGREYQLRRNDVGVRGRTSANPPSWVQSQPGRRIPFWMQLAARGAAWRKGRALQWNRRTKDNSKRPNLLQLLLHPINRFAAAIWCHVGSQYTLHKMTKKTQSMSPIQTFNV